jgi:hypothetical protein
MNENIGDLFALRWVEEVGSLNRIQDVAASMKIPRVP